MQKVTYAHAHTTNKSLLPNSTFVLVYFSLVFLQVFMLLSRVKYTVPSAKLMTCAVQDTKNQTEFMTRMNSCWTIRCPRPVSINSKEDVARFKSQARYFTTFRMIVCSKCRRYENQRVPHSYHVFIGFSCAFFFHSRTIEFRCECDDLRCLRNYPFSQMCKRVEPATSYTILRNA